MSLLYGLATSLGVTKFTLEQLVKDSTIASKYLINGSESE